MNKETKIEPKSFPPVVQIIMINPEYPLIFEDMIFEYKQDTYVSKIFAKIKSEVNAIKYPIHKMLFSLKWKKLRNVKIPIIISKINKITFLSS